MGSGTGRGWGVLQLFARDVRNFRDYASYSVRYLLKCFSVISVIEVVFFVLGVISTILNICVLFSLWGLPGNIEWFPKAINFLMIVGWVGTVILAFFRRVEDRERKLLYVEPIKDIYADVKEPCPKGQAPWHRRVIRIMKDGHLVEETTIYSNDEVDEWLYENEEDVQIVRNRQYEKDLKKKIRNHYLSTYMMFLRHNHRVSRFYGRQFQNENKWGISKEFYPKDKQVEVHKTCYFDTYLTNIIPGKQLLSTRSETSVASAGKEIFLPYKQIGGEKRLRDLGELVTANELGVTTLCFWKNLDYIPLWTQTHQAQSSRAQLVASGSGSADWDDCKCYLNGTENGFRKAIIRGMERELYEESIGKRDVSAKAFFNATQTEIIGYFRWLAKGAKSEFVGISKTDLERLLDKIAPEETEVTQGDMIPSKNIYGLKEKLEALVCPGPQDPEDPDKEIYISNNCSISCTATILALQNLCRRKVCEGCPNKEHCDKDTCNVDPCQALFHDKDR